MVLPVFMMVEDAMMARMTSLLRGSHWLRRVQKVVKGVCVCVWEAVSVDGSVSHVIILCGRRLHKRLERYVVLPVRLAARRVCK